MDCSICSPVRPPTNSICQACYEGAKGMLDFLNKLEHNREIIDRPSSSNLPKSNSSKFHGISDALKWVKDMHKKLSFLSGLVTVFKDGIPADIQVKPDNGSSIFAHRVVLAARSGIFKNMLETNGCKAPPNETISLPELNHEALESLLEFLYSESLPIDKLDKNIYSLSVVAHKYEIPFLLKICENRMLESIDSSNALDVLEISDVCSTTKLKQAAMDFIIKQAKEIVISYRYDAFVHKNPHLSVQITRALSMGIQNKHHSRGRNKTRDSRGKNESGSKSGSVSKSRSSRSGSSRSSKSGRSGSSKGKRGSKRRGGKRKSKTRGEK